MLGKKYFRTSKIYSSFSCNNDVVSFCPVVNVLLCLKHIEGSVTRRERNEFVEEFQLWLCRNPAANNI